MRTTPHDPPATISAIRPRTRPARPVAAPADDPFRGLGLLLAWAWFPCGCAEAAHPKKKTAARRGRAAVNDS